jgi:hypothetical protein
MGIYSDRKKETMGFCFFGSWYDEKWNKVRLPENTDIPDAQTCENWKERPYALSAPWDE